MVNSFAIEPPATFIPVPPPADPGLTGLRGQLGQGWNLTTAGGFLTMVVPIAVFLALQRYFVRGLTAGAVKG